MSLIQDKCQKKPKIPVESGQMPLTKGYEELKVDCGTVLEPA